MATIENRSRYTVSVKNRTDLYLEFPFTQLKQAKQYAIGQSRHRDPRAANHCDGRRQAPSAREMPRPLLGRLFQDDAMPYLESMGDYWGESCAHRYQNHIR